MPRAPKIKRNWLRSEMRGQKLILIISGSKKMSDTSAKPARKPAARPAKKLTKKPVAPPPPSDTESAPSPTTVSPASSSNTATVTKTSPPGSNIKVVVRSDTEPAASPVNNSPTSTDTDSASRYSEEMIECAHNLMLLRYGDVFPAYNARVTTVDELRRTWDEFCQSQNPDREIPRRSYTSFNPRPFDNPPTGTDETNK
ncbi:hypothetical protein TWF696_007780 [Orbilia brochopaga]|uniref:Uncharacterized protein n=1 Tax=Orbilia brochopaga TaxID=3140254 RepID=A0AAV9UPK5_9PEZI